MFATNALPESVSLVDPDFEVGVGAVVEQLVSFDIISSSVTGFEGIQRNSASSIDAGSHLPYD